MEAKLRTNHVYGNTVLPSDWCPRCQRQSLIVGGLFTCCNKAVEELPAEQVIFEVDKVGAKRRKPSKKWRDKCLAEQENKCFYCGDTFGTERRIQGEWKTVNLVWDHVVPFVFNHNNHLFVAACSLCNAMKSCLMFADLDEAKRVLQLKMHERKKEPTRAKV